MRDEDEAMPLATLSSAVAADFDDDDDDDVSGRVAPDLLKPPAVASATLRSCAGLSSGISVSNASEHKLVDKILTDAVTSF